ncbi:MAG: enoyl-CoA hydratase/isomerase family protein [Myxococcota bacterium]|nr:enoyl-CoA hydratase/isomerase family protein [Myxococcota bacterium]
MESAPPLVVREDEDATATLTLNRPEKLNAINIPLMVALRAHLDSLAGDPSVRCVVLTGAGRSFCAGHDLETIATGERAPSRHFEPETIDALEALPMPTIAKIRGHCFTGGLELALGCDLLLATEDAKLGDTHGQWGLVPVWGMSVRLPERVGRARAKELMFTSRRIDGAEAAAIGLVDRAVPADGLDAAVAELASEITANSPGTNRIAKALLAGHADRSRSDALLLERNRPYGAPEDRAERMSASRRSSKKSRG